MHVVMLIPWRAGEKFRDANWEVARPYLEGLGYPLYTGDAPGRRWSRSAACNAASEAAGGWDVAIIADADTVLEVDPVAWAVARVQNTKGAVRPHDKRWMLDRRASLIVGRKGPEGLEERNLRSTAPGGGALVVSRQAWDVVGGYDEHFVEWGYEDSAMNINLAVHTRWEIRAGNAYHLWHPLPSTHSTSAQANRALLDAQRATYARVIRDRSRAAGFDLNTVL